MKRGKDRKPEADGAITAPASGCIHHKGSIQKTHTPDTLRPLARGKTGSQIKIQGRKKKKKKKKGDESQGKSRIKATLLVKSLPSRSKVTPC
jgi:hypothetical protein